MTTAPPQMHLFAFLWNTGGHSAAWRLEDAPDQGLHHFPFYRALAETAERGKFDAVFFADSQGFPMIRGRDAFSRTDLVKLEPLTLLAALAVSTRRIGLVATASTTYNNPYTVARQFASIDHLSNGRTGWNIVTSTGENEAHNFGLERSLSHQDRYARAREFVEVVEGLWDSFEDDALVRDKVSGAYFDPAKLHGLNHHGRFLNVSGPLNIGRPPQGHPVLVQAGSSEDGRDFAATFAEAVFTSHPTIETARPFYAELKRLAAAKGRASGSIKILPSIQPLVAETEAEAQAIAASLDALLHPVLAVSMLGMFLGGVDLSGFPVDGPLPPIPVTENAKSTRARVIDLAERENLTLGQLAQRVAAERTSKSIIGTPGMIADVMEEWFTGGAADGFIVAPPYLPGGLDRFVDLVVPVLQKRGLFRLDYEGDTLRSHLGLDRPINVFQASPGRHAEPEIW